MKFVSTRDKNSIVNGPQAVIKGISPEGGLYVPTEFPSLGKLEELMELKYTELASHILNLYFEELGLEKIREISEKAYDSKFPDEVVPLRSADGIFMELYHGKTHAFKDMALSVLPHLLKASLEEMGNENKILILVATSGDTGKAALEGFKDVEGIEAMVFYPEGGVSEIQRLQMASQEGENLDVFSIVGNFDVAQTAVKKAFVDKEFKEELLGLGYELSSANSINIGRLIPQIIYYVYSYLRLVESGDIELNDSINVCVPTGNFGNILAAYYAKRMGLPIKKLIVASNENNVLTDFFTSGTYDSARDLHLTSSPSMDILVSSNLERFLYHISSDNTQKISESMENLDRNKSYEWGDFEEDLIFAGFADEGEISQAINSSYNNFSYVLDPHTAVAYSVYKEYREFSGDKNPTLIASTASPYKFPGKVLESLAREVPKDEFERLKELSELSDRDIPEDLAKLKTSKVLHQRIIEADHMQDIIKETIGGKNV